MADKNFTQFLAEDAPDTGAYFVGHGNGGTGEERWPATGIMLKYEAGTILENTGTYSLVRVTQDGPDPDARGANTTDLQFSRDNANQVAAEPNSTILGGENNRINGSAGTHAAIVGGKDNDSYGDYSFVGGGRENTVAANYSCVAGGYQAKADQIGQQAHASGKFTEKGDAQTSTFVLRADVSGASATEFFLDGLSATLDVPTNKTWAFTILVAGKRTDGGSSGSSVSIFNGGIKNESGSTTMIGQGEDSYVDEDLGSITVSAFASQLKIVASGYAGKEARWVATVIVSEVK